MRPPVTPEENARALFWKNVDDGQETQAIKWWRRWRAAARRAV